MLSRIHLFPFVNNGYSHHFATTSAIIHAGKNHLWILKSLGERFVMSRILAESQSVTSHIMY